MFVAGVFFVGVSALVGAGCPLCGWGCVGRCVGGVDCVGVLVGVGSVC